MAKLSNERHRRFTLVRKPQLTIAAESTPTNDNIDRLTQMIEELNAKHKAVQAGIKSIEKRIEWLNERERYLLEDDKRSALRDAVVQQQVDILNHREHMLRIREQHMFRRDRAQSA